MTPAPNFWLGHGGTDYQELSQFLSAVRNKTQTPLDVYDSVVMSVINPLSEKSIAEGGNGGLPGLHPRQVEDQEADVCAGS